MNLVTVAVAACFALLTALLSAAESAFFSLTREDREAIRTQESRANRALRAMLETPRDTVFTIEATSELTLVATTLCIAALVLEAYGLPRGWLTLLVAPLLLILCLILPRAVAARYPRQIARSLALPIQGLRVFLIPLLWPLKWASEAIMDVVGIASVGGHRLEESEFKTLVDIGEKEGTLREQERELIHNVFEFGDMMASELMTPRTDVIGFSIDTPVERILEGIKEQRFARVPIYRSNLDTILGILYTKDLLALRAYSEAGGRSLRDLLHKVYYVPVTKKADELFREFQGQKIHLAVVVDEYGGVAGIVTMDDLLAELFGVMLDEHDVEEPLFTELGEQTYRIQAHLDLDEFCELMSIELPEVEEVNTVGGFVMSLFGALPQEGDLIRGGGLEFVVEKVEGTRILEIRARKLPDEAETPTSEVEGSE